MSVKKASRDHVLSQQLDAPLETPADPFPEALQKLGGALNTVLADIFALYLKTKNFHWHMSSPHFHDYQELLAEQSSQIFSMTNPLAERVRKIGGQTLKSIGDIARTQHVLDNDADYVNPLDMLAELLDDNNALAVDLRRVQNLCGVLHDVTTARLIENWIGETERRTRCLLEAGRLETGEN